MHTPSLQRRVTAAGLSVVTASIVVLAGVVVLTVRAQLESALEAVLDARVELVEEVHDPASADQLANRLQALGVTSTVTTPDGTVHVGEPAVPRFGAGPPGPLSERATSRESRTVTLDDGTVVEVSATRVGVDATLRRVLLVVVIGSTLASLVGLLLLGRSTTVALAPLGDVVEAARRRAAGQRGERLRPDDPSTELGQVALAYDQMLDAVDEALNAARDAEQRTRGFLDDAAHQLRTPIAGIRSSVEALLRQTDPEDGDRLMTNLVREAARASRVLHSLLTLARLDAGQPPERVTTDLAAICRDEVARATSLAPHLHLSLTGAETAAEVCVDPTAIREALANLLDNARRHAGTRIEVTLGRDDEASSVRVRDDGPGLGADLREEAFERFVSCDGYGGSGLGLPIGREIARSHGGDLTYGDGFVLRLPRDRPAQAPASPGPQTP